MANKNEKIRSKEDIIIEIIKEYSPSTQGEISELCAKKDVKISQAQVSNILKRLNLNTKINGVYTVKTEAEELLELLIKSNEARCSTFLKFTKTGKIFKAIHLNKHGDEEALCNHLMSVFDSCRDIIIVPAYCSIMLMGRISDVSLITNYINSIQNPDE